VLILLSFYGFFADALTVTDEGELNPLGFIILLLLAGCAIALYKTRIYLINMICFGALSIIYLIRMIVLEAGLIGYLNIDMVIDLDSFKVVYRTHFIALFIITAVLTIKYLREYKTEKILSIINRLKDAKILTLDEMNSIVLSGMYEKRKGIFLIIGIVSCFFIVLSNIFSSHPFDGDRILSILSFLCMGLFLYAIHSNIKNGKPIMQLNRCFNIALCAFIIQLCSLIIFSEIQFLSQFIILVVVNIGLCFSFNKIRSGFKGKLGNVQLKISIIFSMVCLCVSLALSIFYDYTSLIYCGFPKSSIANYFFRFMFLTEITETILMAAILLVLSNMLRNLKAFAVNTEALEEIPLVM
jgi:hypothetical protein